MFSKKLERKRKVGWLTCLACHHQKGAYVAFFSASVYYSLNFQQLVVVYRLKNRPFEDKRMGDREGSPTLWEKSAWRNYFVSMLHS